MRKETLRKLENGALLAGVLFGAVSLVGSTVACSSQQVTTRTVDDPSGEATQYGAPSSTKFSAEIDAGLQNATVTVYQTSTCDVIPVTVMQRYQETLRGDEVIDRSPLSKRQVAGSPRGSVACGQTYARNVEVLVEAEGGRFSVGETDELGRVSFSFSDVFKVGSLEELPAEAKVLLRSQKAQPLAEAGTLSLGQLAKHQARVTELLTELEGIFERTAGTQAPADIGRSYEIYNQLVDLAPTDPRVQAAAARFWELLLGRKRDEALQNLGKNLDALSKAQALLRVMGDAAIPLYVQAAVSSGTLDRRALEWSSLRLVQALRNSPAVCSAGFSFTSVPTYGWSRDAELGAQYVHFAHGSSYADGLRHACGTF